MEVWKLGGASFPRRHKGTRGPGHFTVQRIAPHYRAHPTRFYVFLGKPPRFAIGRIGPIRPLGRRLPPLCRTVCLTPRRGAPVSPESPASPDPGRVHLRCTNSPKHGVRSPPCPIGPRAGRAPCAHARPAPCAPSFVSFVSFVISKNTLAVLRAVARRPSLCSSVTLREPLCSSGICGSLPVFSWRRKTPGAMPSGVELPGVLCKEPYWMEESVSFPAWRSARRAGVPGPSGSSSSPRGSCPCCRAPGTNGRSRCRRRSA